MSPSVEASPGVARDRGNQDKNGMKPVCIKTISRSFVDDQFTAADGSQLSQVTVVGRVTSSESNNQRSDYKLSDSSGGSILAREYINDEDIEQPPLISEGSYVRVYGTLKSFQGSPHVVISRISEIKDPNEITMHLLEMTHTYLRMKNIGTGGGGSSGGGSGGVDKSANVNDQVRTVIQGNKSVTGFSVSEIKSALSHVPPDQIMNAINFLSGEGFIFSTIDDDHFRATEDA